MFEYMDYIYEVYREQNFSRAAEKLFISQSSLSLTIKHAEEKIGEEVFNRRTKPISLTDFGVQYIRACEQVMSLRTELGNYIYESNHLYRGTLTIGAGNFYAAYLVAPFIVSFKEKYPNVQINLVEGRSADLEPQLERGDLDILITNATFTSPLFDRQVLFSERLLLVIPDEFVHKGQTDPDGSFCGAFPVSKEDIAAHRFDQKGSSDLTCLFDIPLVGLRPGNDTRIRTDILLKQHNIRPNYLMELDQSSTAFIIASNHFGAAIIADTIIGKLWKDQSISVYNIDSEQAHRDLVIYTNTNKYSSRIQERFLEMLKDQTPSII